MPLSEHQKRIYGAAILLFLFLQPSGGFMRWISNQWTNFSAEAGLRTLIVFQGVGFDILKKAYRAWRGTASSSVVQSKYIECVGHLLNYVVQATMLFIFGGQSLKEEEFEYRELVIGQWWPSNGFDRFGVVLYLMLVFTRVFLAAWWSAYVAASPFLSRQCILFVDRLMQKSGHGPTKADLMA